MKIILLLLVLFVAPLRADVEFTLPDGDVVTLKRGTTWARCVDMYLASYGNQSVATFNIDPTDARLGGSTKTRRMAFLKDAMFHQLSFKGSIRTRAADRLAYDTIWTSVVEPFITEEESR